MGRKNFVWDPNLNLRSKGPGQLFGPPPLKKVWIRPTDFLPTTLIHETRDNKRQMTNIKQFQIESIKKATH